MKLLNKNKGFTLIEILAVIIILGVIMIIALPAVTSYLGGSRNAAYISTVNKYIDTTIGEVSSFEYSIKNKDYTYYIPTKCLDIENDITESPYDEFSESYVVVTKNDDKNDYYYTGYDLSGHGILLTYRDLLEESVIKTDIRSVDTTIGVGTRPFTYVYSDTCDKTGIKQDVTSSIDEKGKKSDVTNEGQTKPTPSPTPTPTGSTPTPTPDNPYAYIPTNGKIKVTIGDNNSTFNRYGLVFSIYQLAYGTYGEWFMKPNFTSATTYKNDDNTYTFSLFPSEIHQRIVSHNVAPVYQRITNNLGVVEFQNLQHGIYFVEMVAGPNNLTVPSMIVFVPNENGSSTVNVVPDITY